MGESLKFPSSAFQNPYISLSISRICQLWLCTTLTYIFTSEESIWIFYFLLSCTTLTYLLYFGGEPLNSPLISPISVVTRRWRCILWGSVSQASVRDNVTVSSTPWQCHSVINSVTVSSAMPYDNLQACHQTKQRPHNHLFTGCQSLRHLFNVWVSHHYPNRVSTVGQRLRRCPTVEPRLDIT